MEVLPERTKKDQIFAAVLCQHARTHFLNFVGPSVIRRLIGVWFELYPELAIDVIRGKGCPIQCRHRSERGRRKLRLDKCSHTYRETKMSRALP
jgi:hypothetical protein